MNRTGDIVAIRVMTYNIHKAIGGVDRRYDLQRVMDIIDHHSPDVAFLQEVDEGVPRSNFDSQVEAIAKDLDFAHRAYQPNVRLKQGHYGNAILSRFPLRETWDLDLTVRFKKRRRALVAKAHLQMEGHDRTIMLCNLHLGLAGMERAWQIRKLMASEQLVHLHHETPAIVGGDFNDVWSSLARRYMLPFGYQSAFRKSRTFPAVMPVRGLDAIYYRGAITMASAFVGHSRLARYASDHLPLIADFHVAMPRGPSKSSPS